MSNSSDSYRIHHWGHKSRPRVLLLQGPVGTFFNHLQSELERRGCDPWRVCFNAADTLFSRRFKRLHFLGGLARWERKLRGSLVAGDVDVIVLFGSERPAHQVARKLGSELGVPVLCLEEGYIRPGYITAEWGGNNAASPLSGRLPPDEFVAPPFEPAVPYKSFGAMGLTATLYFAVRSLFTVGPNRQLFHRSISPLYDAFCWIRNGYRRLAGQYRNFTVIQNLLEHYDRRFYLVPLQVAADSNLKDAAMGWNSERLIRESLISFAAEAPPDTLLVFKVHPLERGQARFDPMIIEMAEALEIAHRVHVIDVGSMGLLARHAAGMITINSTSGLSAIHHGTPLMVMGRSVYAHPGLAICANGESVFDRVWKDGFVAKPAVRQRFLAWLKYESLLAGDFYSARGKRVASIEVANRIVSSLGRPCGVVDVDAPESGVAQSCCGIDRKSVHPSSTAL